MGGSLRVSLPLDRSEREADVVARRVLAMSGPSPLGSVVEADDDVVSRCPGGCDCDEVIHRSGGDGHSHGEVSRADIGGLGVGKPLSDLVRGFFEPRFGADLSQVRVHTGAGADRLASRVGARAFTYHQNVVFRSGEFRPHSGEGRRLLAHELTHAVQQRVSSPQLQRACVEGEGPPGPEGPIPGEEGPHPLVYRGTSRRRSRRPAVGDAQRLLNCFLERLDAGDPPCGPEADLGAIEAIRRTVSPEHDPLVIDCRFGPNTEKVTKMFQRCVFPTQPDEWDGKIGKKTWPELDKLCAAPAPFEFPDLPLFSNVRVWINAFIPRDIIGLTLRVPAGPHAGKTMLGEPTFISDCFLTDQRGFSDRFGASSRMRQRVSVDVSREPFTLVDHTKVCDATHEVDCEDGDEECIDSGDTDRMRASVSSVAGSLGMSALRVHFESAANNPCFGGSPDIDYRGHVTIDLLVRRIDFEILVDSFPAFEMYAQVDGGSPVVLFRRPPPRGNTPGDLPGGPTRQVRGFRFF